MKLVARGPAACQRQGTEWLVDRTLGWTAAERPRAHFKACRYRSPSRTGTSLGVPFPAEPAGEKQTDERRARQDQTRRLRYGADVGRGDPRLELQRQPGLLRSPAVRQRDRRELEGRGVAPVDASTAALKSTRVADKPLTDSIALVIGD